MVARGPELRAQPSPELQDALRTRYGIAGAQGEKPQDLGGSSNLNLLVTGGSGGGITGGSARYVVRVYRPWVTMGRLEDMQVVRRLMADQGVPCARAVHTLDGESWISVGGRLVEVEPFIEHDAKMDSWERLERGLSLLGQMHAMLRNIHVSPEGRKAPASNNIDPQDVLPGVLRAVRQILRWHNASPAELELARASKELAYLVELGQRERGIRDLPRQLVHGDYWDNNVLFLGGRVVLVTDFDFMGERARIADLALTLYYTNSTFSDDPTSGKRRRKLRALVDAYEAGLGERLAKAEHLALPLMLAMAPLAFIAMIPSVDSETGARKLAAEMIPDIAWALSIVRRLDRWELAFGTE